MKQLEEWNKHEQCLSVVLWGKGMIQDSEVGKLLMAWQSWLRSSLKRGKKCD